MAGIGIFCLAGIWGHPFYRDHCVISQLKRWDKGFLKCSPVNLTHTRRKIDKTVLKTIRCLITRTIIMVCRGGQWVVFHLNIGALDKKLDDRHKVGVSDAGWSVVKSIAPHCIGKLRT
jgi:hypothetical protein